MTSTLLNEIYDQYMEIAMRQKQQSKTLTDFNVSSEESDSKVTPRKGLAESTRHIESVRPTKTTTATRATVWFVLGPIGAGKSTYIHHVMKEHPHLTLLSADILKRDHNLSYLETRNLMERIIKGHVDSGISFITEGTGQHDDLYDLFVEYKQNDSLDLRVTYIDVDIEVALERNRKRTRVLTDDTVREVHERCGVRRHRWKDFGCEYISYKDLLVKSAVDGIY
ncbi:hypothetical protein YASMINEVIRUS_1265 [Yasminevirus sp. GU-2018]|uniref:Zeta toxin domain-containing protein n=1 Tax=Yasminevirus sp. GU-2018 TaxID=2420051 RepID=A0A5K0UB25_9VIRU|nr:hypothetical protein YASMINEVIRUS_1265 [Yasminevirus sp. GU-2018]